VNEAGNVQPAPRAVTDLIRGTKGAVREWRRGVHSISTDKNRLDLDVIHGYLGRSYWAECIPRPVVELSIENSLCFGVYATESATGGAPPKLAGAPGRAEKQVGFARLVTDGATFAYLADVFVLEAERGKGLSKWLMHVIMTMPELAGLRRWNLATRDAHGLYRQFGFSALAAPERYMELLIPDAYKRSNAGAEAPRADAQGR
jgi:GNAT superfamily N-acetyltransferase